MSEKNENKKIELSTFLPLNESKSTPIQSALQLPLEQGIGSLFSLMSGFTEEVTDYNNENKNILRAVYEVRILSKKAKLPIGTIVEVKIKDSKSILSKEDNLNLVLGARQPIVAFDDLSHWSFNNREGLSASGIRVINIEPERAMNL